MTDQTTPTQAAERIARLVTEIRRATWSLSGSLQSTLEHGTVGELEALIDGGLPETLDALDELAHLLALPAEEERLQLGMDRGYQVTDLMREEARSVAETGTFAKLPVGVWREHPTTYRQRVNAEATAVAAARGNG